MKIYLAARYTRRNEMREYAKELRALGHTITSQWLMERKDAEMKMEDVTAADHQRFAERDLADIDSADVFIGFVGEKKSDKRGGHHIELGWALAKGKRCIIVEKPENTFHYLKQVEVAEDFEELLDELAFEAEWGELNVRR